MKLCTNTNTYSLGNENSLPDNNWVKHVKLQWSVCSFFNENKNVNDISSLKNNITEIISTQYLWDNKITRLKRSHVPGWYMTSSHNDKLYSFKNIYSSLSSNKHLIAMCFACDQNSTYCTYNLVL